MKDKTEIAIELHELWSNYPLYKFVNGAQWIRKRELEIAQSIDIKDRDDWIELCRTTWQQKQTKKKPR